MVIVFVNEFIDKNLVSSIIIKEDFSCIIWLQIQKPNVRYYTASEIP